METNADRLTLKSWGYLFLAFTAAGVLFSYSVHAEDIARGNYDYPTALLYELTGYWTVFCLLPVFVPLMQRLPFTTSNWVRRTLQHFLLACLFGFLHTTLMYGVRIALFKLMNQAYTVDWIESYLMEYQKQIMGYGIGLGIVHAWRNYLAERRKEKERAELELKSSQLETQLVQARLQTLEAQLHPHFLFNTLNAVSSLMYEDVDRADKMIADLSRLLRLALEGSGNPVVPLNKEREFLVLYLEIMKGRYEENLVVDLETDVEAEAALVPNLITQPLVENAIKHLQTGPGRPAEIQVTAKRRADSLVLSVRDNGPGLDADPETCMQRGTGLTNTKARLQTLYGEKARMELVNLPTGGLCVTLTLPFQTAAADVN
ncbi:MAG: histidine kinase [Acidobacteriota bacterium]|nr:histidine kinase [Acidobacteriota bacterium]